MPIFQSVHMVAHMLPPANAEVGLGHAAMLDMVYIAAVTVCCCCSDQQYSILIATATITAAGECIPFALQIVWVVLCANCHR